MKPTTRHWKILRTIRDCPGMLIETIAELTDLSLREVAGVTGQMLDQDFGEGGAWIYVERDRYHLAGVERDGECSTGGYAAIEEATANGQILFKVQPWRDEVLTGMKADGNQTKIERAVLSTATKKVRKREDGEDRFVRLARERELEAKEESELVRRCSVKGCLAPIETANKVCNSCNRKKVRECRRGK